MPKRTKQQSKSIQTYIHKEIENGVSLSQIKDNLRTSGWSQEEVKQEFQKSLKKNQIDKNEFDHLFPTKKTQKQSKKNKKKDQQVEIWQILKQSIKQVKVNFLPILIYIILSFLFYFNALMIYLAWLAAFLTGNIKTIVIKWLEQTPKFNVRLLWQFFLKNYQASIIFKVIIPGIVLMSLCVLFGVWTKTSLTIYLTSDSHTNKKKSKKTEEQDQRTKFLKSYYASFRQILPASKLFFLRHLAQVLVYFGLIVVIVTAQSASVIKAGLFLSGLVLLIISTFLSLSHLFLLGAGRIVLLALTNSFQTIKKYFWQIFLTKLFIYLVIFFLALLVALVVSLILNQFDQVVFQVIKVIVLLKLLMLALAVCVSWTNLFNYCVFQSAQK